MISRRDFLISGGSVAIGVAAGAVFLGKGSSSVQKPDLIVKNGLVYTSDPSLPRAEAFAVKGDRFLAVGSNDDIMNLSEGSTRVLDAEGMTIVAGFIDAHSHPAGGGVSELVSVNCDLRSIDAIKEAIRDRAKKTPKGEWVTAFKYDDTKVKEGRKLRREDLDEAAPEHPVHIRHRGGHTAWYNSKAFELAGITAETPDPQGGKFYKRDGTLDGMVAERANYMITRLIPSDITRAQRQAGVKLISKLMTASGLTTVHDAGCSRNNMIAYRDALDSGEMQFRVYMMIRGDGLYNDLKESALYTGFGDVNLRIGGVKYSADGSASERTMRMSTSYEGRPNDYGILTMTQEEIHEAVEDAHRNGFQIGIHANGDVTIDMVLNAYERVIKKWPRPNVRHRIEHCSLINPSLLNRIKETGSIPTPFYTYVHYHGNKWVEYGEEKMKSMFAHRSFLDYNIPVAGASDYTPGPYEPLMAIQSMVTRKDFKGRVWGPNQRVSVAEALKICTINGAYASFEENVKGSITRDKLADFVILEKDPHNTEPDRIKKIGIVRTVVGGKTVYEA